MRSHLLFTALCVFTFSLSAQSQKGTINAKSGVGVQGYDLVSYQLDQQAIKGSKSIKREVDGVSYYFHSEENAQKFDLDKSRYLPAYGGWCAYAMGKDGSKVSINPLTFKVLDGTLYLFYDKWGTNTLDLWNVDESTLKDAADLHWSRLAGKM